MSDDDQEYEDIDNQAEQMATSQRDDRQNQSPIPSKYNNLLSKQSNRQMMSNQSLAYNQRQTLQNLKGLSQNSYSKTKKSVTPKGQQYSKDFGKILNQSNNIYNQAALQKLAQEDFENHQTSVEAGQQYACYSCQATNKSLAYTKLVSNQSMVYSQNVPIIYASSNDGDDSIQAKPKKKGNFLRIEIEILQQAANILKQRQSELFNHIKAQHNDIIFITVSDDSNPQFLYFNTIDINNFLAMRKQQNFNIEFPQFPQKAVELLNFCISSQYSHAQQNDNDLSQTIIDNRFFSALSFVSSNPDSEDMNDDQEKAILDIFENNEFRNLLHLRVNLNRATHEEARKWLAKKLLLHKRANIELQQECQELKYKGQESESILQELEKSLENLRDSNDKIIQQKESEWNEKFQQQQDDFEQQKADQEEKFEIEKQQASDQFERDKGLLIQEIERLKEQIVLLSDSKNTHSEQASLQKQRNEILSSDYQNLQQDNASLLNQLEQLRKQNAQLDKQLLEQTLLKDQCLKEIEKLNLIQREQQQQSAQIQEQLTSQQSQNDQLKEKSLLLGEQIKVLENNLERAKVLGLKHEEKAKKYKEKAKKKKKELKKAEHKKEALEQNIQDNSDQIKTLNENIYQLNQVISEKDKAISSLEQKLNECSDTLKSNAQMIEYLNKSLTEAQKVSFRTMVNQRGKEFTFQEKNQLIPTQTIGQNSPGKYNQGSQYFSPSKQVNQENQYSKDVTTKSLRSYTYQQPDNKSLYNKYDKSPSLQTATIDNPKYTSFRTKSPYGDQSQSQKDNFQTIPNQPQTEIYRPPRDMNLPLTEFYLNKQNDTMKSPIFGTNQYQESYSKQFNNQGQTMNPFQTQLERDKIISGDKLKSRFDEQKIYRQQPQTVKPYSLRGVQNYADRGLPLAGTNTFSSQYQPSQPYQEYGASIAQIPSSQVQQDPNQMTLTSLGREDFQKRNNNILDESQHSNSVGGIVGYSAMNGGNSNVPSSNQKESARRLQVKFEDTNSQK